EDDQAFPNDARRSALAAELLQQYAEVVDEDLQRQAVEVQVAGRMMARRVMGRLSFAKLQDESGQLQLSVQRDVLSEADNRLFRSLDLGDIIWVRGTLFRTRTGELTVRVAQLRLLVKSLRPLPEKFHGL